MKRGEININTKYFEKNNNLIVVHRIPNKNNFYNIGTIHMSQSYGPFKILDNNAGKSPNGTNLFTIQFLSSNYILTNVRRDHIKDGHVRDHSYSLNIIGSIVKSNNYGYFKVLYEVDRTSHNILYRIKFIDTGYETNSWLSNIRKGDIIDPLYRRVRGIGYLGEDFKILRDEDPKLYKSLKSKWESMLDRCYSDRDNSYKSYGGIGVTVDKRWHSFSNFYKDTQKLYGFNRDEIIANNGLHLDKDLKQLHVPKNKRVYSKDTCVWLSPKNNISIRNIDKRNN